MVRLNEITGNFEPVDNPHGKTYAARHEELWSHTMNERITEGIVRKKLESLGYENVEEQTSKTPRIQKLLKHASKKGTGSGKPEFIIQDSTSDYLIVIECKADIHRHTSETKDRYADYAVDGVRNYASYLNQEYNVIAIAVSGQTEDELRVTNYFWGRNDNDWKVIHNRQDKELNEIVSFDEYKEILEFDPKLEKKKHKDLIAFSRKLHVNMWEHGKLSEDEKPLMVSGVLTALQNNVFSNEYTKYREEPRHSGERSKLAKKFYDAIEEGFEDARIPDHKVRRKVMLQPYSFILDHINLSKKESNADHTPLRNIIDAIKENIGRLSAHDSHDVIGQFYGEFLKYTGGDKKALGIVLTPRHICDLFTDLVSLTPKSKVMDTCAGTGSFLVASMAKMMNKARDSEKEEIKSNGLYGVEQNPKMYSLATSNMFLRGDGKSNLYLGSCFDPEISEKLKEQNIRYAFINPPYSQKGDKNQLHELSFVKHTLDLLRPEGQLVAIVPMSCAIQFSFHKEKILENHRLDAVMSMPDELFYPVGVVTCIMVFTAGIPHSEDPYYKTWFGYWKDDGFIKTKPEGRKDNGNWENIKRSWLDAYRYKKEKPGSSVLQSVTSKDEWCSEAYMETDYSNITEKDFVAELKKYGIFKLSYYDSEIPAYLDVKNSLSDECTPKLNEKIWKNFKCEEIFDITLGTPIHKNKITNSFNEEYVQNSIPYVTRTTRNNGVEGFVTNIKKTQYKNAITIGAEGFLSFYQEYEFVTGNKVNIVRNHNLNKMNGIFICTILNREIRKRFNYGRAIVSSRLKNLFIRLPVNNDGTPDWQWMEDYIKTLSWSKSI